MSASTDYQDKPAKEPSEMEQDINYTRERIGRTVEELEQRLSPGQLMDQALGYAREHGGDFASSVAGSVRRNPLPMIVTGLGIAWLLASQSSRRSAGSTGRVYSPYDDTADMYDGGPASDGSSLYRGVESDRDSSLYRGVDSGASGLYRGSESGGYDSDRSGGGLKDKLAGVGETIKSKVSGMRSSAASSGGSVGEKLRSTRDSLSDRAHGLVDSAQSATRSLRHRASGSGQGSMEQFRRAKGEFATLMEEQPLLLGAVGVAIGATIAALVPTTRRERELMGGASDSLADRASELASQKYEELRESASQTVDEFTRSLKEGKAEGKAGGENTGGQGSMGRRGSATDEGGRSSATSESSRRGDSIAQGMGRSSDQGVGSVSATGLSGAPAGSSSQSKDRIGESMGGASTGSGSKPGSTSPNSSY